jgi:ABC-type Fe3+ transport system permease subunit
MCTRKLVVTALAVVAVALVGVASSHARSSFHRTNYLTFNGPVSLPGVTLAAGAYTFVAGPMDSDPSLVRVLTRDGRQVLYQGFTTPVTRPAGRAVPAIVFGEARANAPMPIRVWYPTLSSVGYQFRY